MTGLATTNQNVDLEASANQLNEWFDKLVHQRNTFSLKACEHLIHVMGACKAGKFDKIQLMYRFEYVKAFSWALTDELKEVANIGASPKIKDDSYFRVVDRNLTIVRNSLASAPKH
ncbi:MAG: hypothetical protein AABX47_10095 [Nanoarchaeota archaeon]